MTGNIGDSALLREYLLGRGDKTVREQIEQRLLTEDAFGDVVSVAESELIESFLDGELNHDESHRFINHFLISPERQRQLRFTRNLRELSSRAKATPGTLQAKRFIWLHFRPLQVAFVVSLLVVASIAIWRFNVTSSDEARGLALLEDIYRTRRPTDTRLTTMSGYAPFSQTRGPVPDQAEARNRELASRYLLDARTSHPSARSHHALGIFYLTGGELVKAQEELSLAVEIAPEDAKLQSDVGASFLESAKFSASMGDGESALRMLDESIQHLETAISIDPSLNEAYFNRALCLQQLTFNEQAKAAWKRYIEIDPNSPWTEEAKQNLANLEASEKKEVSTETVDSDFLEAFNNRDEVRVSGLLSSNRELIRERYLPQRLTMALVNAPPDRRRDFLDALRYGSDVEFRATGDPFVRDIARFYFGVSDSEIVQLRLAHEKMRAGYKQSLEQDFESALESFSDAKSAFGRAGDVWESKIAQYLIAYSLINKGEVQTGLRELLSVRDYAKRNGFHWLDATALYWIGGAYVKTSRHSDAVQAYKEALRVAEQMRDHYAIERNLLEISNRFAFAGQNSRSLEYLSKALTESAGTTPGRQRYRTLVDSFATLSRATLFYAARFSALEAVALADSLPDVIWRAQSRSFAAAGFIQDRDYITARQLLDESNSIAESIPNQSARKRQHAFTDLRYGLLEQKTGNYEAAEQYLLKAKRYYDLVDMPLNREEVYNGLLLTLAGGNKTSDLEALIPAAIQIAEQYRGRIIEESQRSSFLGSRTNVYDIAAEFEYRRGNIRKAYDYSEMSTSRALLDRMSFGIKTSSVSNEGLGIALAGSVVGQSSESIQKELPDGVQILQYSVFENGLLLWVITRERFVVREVKISSKDLSDLVTEFQERISRRETIESSILKRLGKELYGFLIEPVASDLDSSRELCIIPSKFLENVSIPALINPDNRFVISEFRSFEAPSANAFLRLSELSATRAAFNDESILAVGNPRFDRREFEELDYLPSAEIEAKDVARNYSDSVILLNERATKEAFFRYIGNAEVVHFSGHYVNSPGMPYTSFLVMAGDRRAAGANTVTDLDFSKKRFQRTKLVVLAACGTGTGSLDNADGIGGLTRTMLAMESPLVVGSRWPVDSQATSNLMSRFHALRKQTGLTTVAALRQSELEMLGDSGGIYSAPYFWAAFSVFGGHAPY